MKRVMFLTRDTNRSDDYNERHTLLTRRKLVEVFTCFLCTKNCENFNADQITCQKSFLTRTSF